MYVKRDLFYFNQLFNSSENITWEPQRNPEITIKPFKEYDKPHGPTFLSPTSILGIFQMFFTTELLQIIVTETNRYASLCLKDKFATWEQVTEEELQAYFGFMILTGLVRLPSIRDYWKKSDKFYYKPIASRITRPGFLKFTDSFTLSTTVVFLPMDNQNTVNYRKSNLFLNIFQKNLRTYSFLDKTFLLTKLW